LKIGVIDTDGRFVHSFYKDKNINIVRLNPGSEKISAEYPFTHAEYVCATILLENPRAELFLYNVVGEKYKKSGHLLVESIYHLIKLEVNLINISVGIESCETNELYVACIAAKEKGITIIAAHANDESKLSYPASFKEVIGITKAGVEDQHYSVDFKAGNILFIPKSYVSFRHLGQEHLMEGNSFLAAKITGIISCFCFKSNYMLFLKEIQSTCFNHVCDFTEFRSSNAVVISDRCDEIMQKKYLQECYKNTEIISLDVIQSGAVVNSYELLVIDVRSYENFLCAKNNIKKFLRDNRTMFKQCFIRYPFFSLQERIDFYEQERVLIRQLLL
jgi:hypothetical protein